jgi:hypothetical protein
MNAVSRLSIPGLCLTLALAGCLSSGHRIPPGELMRVSQAPPEQRGEKLRVIQGLGGSEEPPHAPRAGGGVVVVAPIWIDGTPHHHRHRASSAPTHHSSHRGGSNLAAGKKDSAKAWLVIAAVVTAALAFTEGARYDGWVKVHPMQPVHMWGAYGDYTWMPLAHVTPEVAQWAHKAVVRDDEGPWQPLGRAPLNRQGWTYSLLLGTAEIAVLGLDPQPGFGSHIEIGYFPTHIVGLQVDIGYGWAADRNDQDIFDGRLGLELDVLPLSAGIFHAGGYGEVGISSRSDDGVQFDDSSGFFGAGAIAQLELTTRLALTVRAGLTRAYEETLAEITGGVSIY